GLDPRAVIPLDRTAPFLALLSLSAACGSSAATTGAAASAAGSGGSTSTTASTTGSSATSTTAAGGASTAGATSTGGAGGSIDKSAPCASTFGSALTDAFGRLDGTVVAVVPPNDQACAQPNMTHLVLQVEMEGAVYRMVLDVLSNQGSPDVL